MEIKWKITELESLIERMEKDVDLSSTFLAFDSYAFLKKNKGKLENKFIIKHKTNKEKYYDLMLQLQSFVRQLKKILRTFELEESQNAQKIQQSIS